MAGASLLALIDDIAAILDDVAVLTKVAAKKTAGVLGDDLALNAQQVASVRAERELPVVWAVAVGSIKNKLILVPSALAISALAPWAVLPLLMLGGLYLCFEGVEKLAHKLLHGAHEVAAEHARELAAFADPAVDLVALERGKIKGAIRTDFVLSAEIIVITLGTVADKAFATQIAVLSGIGLIMTVGVYGIVAGIVKIDDVGLYLFHKSGAVVQAVGRALLSAAPLLMKALTVIGTAAMFMVGGGILTHGIPPLHHAIEHAAVAAGSIAAAGGVLKALTPTLLDMIAGVVAGAMALAGVRAFGAAAAALRQSRQAWRRQRPSATIAVQSHRAITMTTLEIRFSLPDKVANDAKAAGLLTPEAIETLIAEALRRKAFDELLSNTDRVEAAGIAPMSMQEIIAEIEAYRAERRRAG